MPTPAANRYHADFFETFEEIRQAVGDVAAQKVLKIFTMRHGGQQMTIPDPQDIYREDRDRQICKKFDGVNIVELGILFHLSPTQIRRILAGKRR